MQLELIQLFNFYFTENWKAYFHFKLGTVH